MKKFFMFLVVMAGVSFTANSQSYKLIDGVKVYDLNCQSYKLTHGAKVYDFSGIDEEVIAKELPKATAVKVFKVYDKPLTSINSSRGYRVYQGENNESYAFSFTYTEGGYAEDVVHVVDKKGYYRVPSVPEGWEEMYDDYAYPGMGNDIVITEVSLDGDSNYVLVYHMK